MAAPARCGSRAHGVRQAVRSRERREAGRVVAGTTIGLLLLAFAVAGGSFLFWNSWDMTRKGPLGDDSAAAWVTLAFVAVPTAVIAGLALVSLLV